VTTRWPPDHRPVSAAPSSSISPTVQRISRAQCSTARSISAPERLRAGPVIFGRKVQQFRWSQRIEQCRPAKSVRRCHLCKSQTRSLRSPRMRTSHQWHRRRAGLRLLQPVPLLQEVRLVLAHLWDHQAQEDPVRPLLLAALLAPAIQLSLLALQDQPDPQVPVPPQDLAVPPRLEVQLDQEAPVRTPSYSKTSTQLRVK
jgi:hypothetical protein